MSAFHPPCRKILPLSVVFSHLAVLDPSSRSLLSISSIETFSIKGPNSCRSDQSLHAPRRRFGAVPTGAAEPLGHVSSWSPAPWRSNPRSYASRLCRSSSSRIACEMIGSASPVRPSSAQYDAANRSGGSVDPRSHSMRSRSRYVEI